jgi:hypothetical protein
MSEMVLSPFEPTPDVFFEQPLGKDQSIVVSVHTIDGEAVSNSWKKEGENWTRLIPEECLNVGADPIRRAFSEVLRLGKVRCSNLEKIACIGLCSKINQRLREEAT